MVFLLSFSRLSTCMPGRWQAIRSEIAEIIKSDIFFANCSIPSSPASEYWNLFAESRTCEAEGPPLMGQTCVTVLNDLLVYILPMPTQYQLNLPRWNRVDLMVVFGLRSIVCIVGVCALFVDQDWLCLPCFSCLHLHHVFIVSFSS
jgi:hypothetical protein